MAAELVMERCSIEIIELIFQKILRFSLSRLLIINSLPPPPGESEAAEADILQERVQCDGVV